MVTGLRRTTNQYECPQFQTKKSPAKIRTSCRLSPTFLLSRNRTLRGSAVLKHPQSSYIMRKIEINSEILSSNSSFSTYSSSRRETWNDTQTIGFGILKGISSLCLGSSRSKIKSPFSAEISIAALPEGKKKTICNVIVYPRANRLDNKKLISERRQQFFEQNLFRPISLDE